MKKKKLILILGTVILIGMTAAGLNLCRMNREEKISAAVNLEKPHRVQNVPKKKLSVSKPAAGIEKARQEAEKYIGSKDVGLYCIELKSGKSFGVNQDKIYYAASTGKLPEILYTQKKLDEGSISMDTKFPYHDYVNNISGAMVRGGTGVLKDTLYDGQLVSVGQLLKYACSYSDNLASNMLGYYVCDKNDGDFKAYISSVLSKNIPVFSKNFSAKDTAVLMQHIYVQGSRGGGQSILYLQNTNWDSVKIPKYLPVKTAHKIGINGSYNHDVAIVYSHNPYIISIMTNGESDEFISQLSKKIYDELK
ncbi:MAG: serine hydrolase [Clostridiales bacterium]|nr:serine hydrolase [Clostridiales bacterium]